MSDTKAAKPVSEPYRCVVIDPPWLERGAGKVKRGADRHYELLHTDAIRGYSTPT